MNVIGNPVVEDTNYRWESTTGICLKLGSWIWSSEHGRRLVKSIGWANQNIGGKRW